MLFQLFVRGKKMKTEQMKVLGAPEGAPFLKEKEDKRKTKGESETVGKLTMLRRTKKQKDTETAQTTLIILIADSFLTRFAGLMFRKKLPPATGLLLAPCNSVHMCFMRFAIDVVYLDKGNKIIKVVKNLKPWIGLSLCNKAWAVLEMTAGEAERCGLEVGKNLRKINLNT